MASRTKLVFNALTSIAFYTFIVFLFLELRPFIQVHREYDLNYNRQADKWEREYTGFIEFTSFHPIQALLGMLAWALIIGFIILLITTISNFGSRDEQLFGNEEKLEWMTYKFIPYLAYGIIGVIVTFDILRGVSHDLQFGGKRRKH